MTKQQLINRANELSTAIDESETYPAHMLIVFNAIVTVLEHEFDMLEDIDSWVIFPANW